MPIAYDHEAGFTIVPEDCEGCDRPRYDTGCVAPGCDGFRCDYCSEGCDIDFGNGRCATALAAEPDEDREARVKAERAAFGLRPLTGEAAGGAGGAGPRGASYSNGPLEPRSLRDLPRPETIFNLMEPRPYQ